VELAPVQLKVGWNPLFASVDCRAGGFVFCGLEGRFVRFGGGVGSTFRFASRGCVVVE